MTKKARRIQPIYVSLDGGETVYEQLPNSDRIFVTITEGQESGNGIRGGGNDWSRSNSIAKEVSYTSKGLGQISYRMAFDQRKSMICTTIPISILPAVCRRLCAFNGVIK